MTIAGNAFVHAPPLTRLRQAVFGKAGLALGMDWVLGMLFLGGVNGRCAVAKEIEAT